MNTSSKPMKQRREELIEGLRSGEFKQTYHLVQRGDCFCVLGAICKIAEKDGIKLNLSSHGILNGTTLFSQPKVRDYYGFKSYNPQINQVSFTEMNDKIRITLPEFADLIEQNMDQIFEDVEL